MVSPCCRAYELQICEQSRGLSSHPADGWCLGFTSVLRLRRCWNKALQQEGKSSAEQNCDSDLGKRIVDSREVESSIISEKFRNICCKVQFIESLGVLLCFAVLAMPCFGFNAVPQITVCCPDAAQLSTFHIVYELKNVKEKWFGKEIFQGLENWFKILNDSEDKTLFWRVQLLPLVWNRDSEDDTCVSAPSVIFWFKALAIGSTTNLASGDAVSGPSQHSYSLWLFASVASRNLQNRW